MGSEPTRDRVARLESELAAARAENARLQAASGTAKPPRRSVAWRSVFSTSLLTLGLLAAIPAGMILWLNRTIVQPDAYINSMGPVIQEPAVQTAIQKSAYTELFERVNIDDKIGEALPENARFLAPPIAAQVKNYANTLIGQIVASPRFAEVWVEANKRGQAAFMNIARNSSGNPEINLDRVYTFIAAQLEDTRLAGLANRQLPENVGSIQVANVPSLERIPHFVAVLSGWVWGLVGGTVLLLALAVALSLNRRRSLVWTGLGLLLSTLITLIIIRITRAVMLDSIPDAVYREAAVAVWQTVLNPFWLQIVVTALLGLALATTGWLLGPGRTAVGVRRHSQELLAQGRQATWPAAEDTPAVQFVRRHHRAFQWGLLGATLLALAFYIPLSASELLLILFIALLLLLTLEFLVAPVRPHETQGHQA